MKNRFGITEEDMIGDLDSFPVGIAVRMLEEQEKQGKKANVEVFQKVRTSNELFGGFSWDRTDGSFEFWKQVIYEKRFDIFFKKHPVYEKYNKKETNMSKETKEIKIDVPEGYEIDKEHSTLECIKFKKITKLLPKTWEEFCEMKPDIQKDYYISTFASILSTNHPFNGIYRDRDPNADKHLLPNKETAEAILALCQLIQLRDCYNDGWLPDWRAEYEEKYTITTFETRIVSDSYYLRQKILSFKTKELRDQFLENFKDLIEIAKPLL